MKGWAKKMIWFFGVFLLSELDDLLQLVIHGVPYTETEAVTAGGVWLILIIVPMFFLGDDKK